MQLAQIDKNVTHTETIEYSEISPTVAIVRLVSSVMEKSPDELEPLYESIDPDAIDALFEPGIDEDRIIAFEYVGYLITVSGETVSVSTQT